MNTLHAWKARRAGEGITITHATGKIANVDSIEPRAGRVVAIDKNGVEYELAVPAED